MINLAAFDVVNLAAPFSLHPVKGAALLSAGPADQYDFYVPGVWGEVQNRMLDAIGALGHDTLARSDPAHVATVTAQADRLRRQLAPFSGTSRVRARRPYPTGTTRSRRGCRASRRWSRRACRFAASRSRRRVSTTRTRVRAPRSTPALTTTAASLFAFQRDLEARGVADRVLTLVWTEFGRRAQENGSGGTDHGAAGTGFLIGTRAAGTAGRRVPRARDGPRRRRQPEGDLRLPRASTRRCSSSGSGFDASRDHPGRAASSARRSSSSEGPRRGALLAVATVSLRRPASGARCRSSRTSSRSRCRARTLKPGGAVIELANFGQDAARPARAADRVARTSPGRASSTPARAPI